MANQIDNEDAAISPSDGWASPHLRSGERVLGTLVPNLDQNLRFQNTAVALTNQRVVWTTESGQNGSVKSLELKSISSVRVREQFGLGRLDLLSADGVVATWNYSAAVFSPAHQFSKQVERVLGGSSHAALEWAPTVCPSCGAVLEPGETVCPACAPTAAPPATKSLIRLWQFANPCVGKS